jgi:alkylhydroperoxidase/carboxymuconolactone decarboxylase family protein YurZ
MLRRLALNDERAVGAALSATTDFDLSILGDKTRALLRIAALIAAESPAASYQWAVSVAMAAGAGDDEIVGVLLSVAAVVGEARVISAAPALASALGYELDPPADF